MCTPAGVYIYLYIHIHNYAHTCMPAYKHAYRHA